MDIWRGASKDAAWWSLMSLISCLLSSKGLERYPSTPDMVIDHDILVCITVCSISKGTVQQSAGQRIIVAWLLQGAWTILRAQQSRHIASRPKENLKVTALIFICQRRLNRLMSQCFHDIFEAVVKPGPFS